MRHNYFRSLGPAVHKLPDSTYIWFLIIGGNLIGGVCSCFDPERAGDCGGEGAEQRGRKQKLVHQGAAPPKHGALSQ